MLTFQQIWRKNHGSLISGIAGLVVACASGLWYLDLLPEIELTPSTSIGESPVPPSVSSLKARLMVTISSSGSLPASPQAGFVTVHAVEGRIGRQAASIADHSFLLAEGERTTVEFESLPPGTYCIVAYLDVNQNGVLDIDDAASSEPFRTPKSPDKTTDDLDFANNSLKLDSRGTTFLYVDF